MATNEPSQDAIDATSLGIIRAAKGAKDKKQGELRAAYSTADLRGLNTDAAKIAIKLRDQGQEAIDEHFKTFERTAHYLKLMGKELSPAQYEMFGLRQGPTPETERAEIEGRAAGFSLDGEPGSQESDNPYPGSVKGNHWLTAFRQARSERNSVLSMKMPESKGSDGEAETEGGADDEGEE
ncbi:hypothetical protein DYI24_00240 [Rhodopseudomonas sp. BR0C11]|uniref:hypothetical protein n=1 Tax=Rhodopseudomonas sp. BR0C11 TaxID=2269370 RepID=UPI0013E0679B|nr:hypothetical protein [Rhodopseudomonas sp. BR0C11]NEV75510.1 hypothetical protein [Rhodopseudomonas sp. BR0C11]